MKLQTLRLLLWLKLTLSWRGYRSGKLKVLSAFIFILMLVPSGIVAAGLHFLLSTPDAPAREAIARDALAVIFTIWLLSPLFGFQLNDSYDPTKLFCYPISYWRIFAGSVVGGLIDPPVLLVMPSIAVLLFRFSNSLSAGVLNMLAMCLFLLLTIAAAQAMTIVMIGFLRSRRFRDITIVVLPLVGMAVYLGQQVFIHQFLGVAQYFQMQRMYDAPAWHVANWLPPGFAAAAMSAAADGDWKRVFLYMTGICAFAVLAIATATQALKRLYFGDVATIGPPPDPVATPTRAGSAAALPAWIPGDIRVLASKDLAYFSRDPQYKAMLAQSMYTIVMLAVVFLVRSNGYGTAGTALTTTAVFALPPFVPLFSVSAALALALSAVVFNVFGADGAAVTVLFSFPTSRRRILIAKNIAHTTVLLLIFAIGLSATATMMHSWSSVPLVFATIVIALPILLASGNLVSIKLPHRMIVRGQRWQRGGVAAGGAGGVGCAVALCHMLAVSASWVAMSPVIAAVIVPLILQAPGYWYLLTLPLACLYSGSLYYILLGVAEGWLMSREPEIMAAVIPPD